MSHRCWRCDPCAFVLALAVLPLVLMTKASAQAAEPVTPLPLSGSAEFTPGEDETSLPEGFRLSAHRFDYTAELLKESSRVRKYSVLFPSPVHTDAEANNTVHAVYMQPREGALGPGVIVLHILGGDFALSESIAHHMASNGIPSLFVKMPYYGERRSPTRNKMITTNPRESAEGMRQGVLDIRQATAWLAARPEVDERRLGITGISLGGIMSALAAGIEPRLTSCALYLGGGDFANVLWHHEDGKAADFRKAWQAAGGDQSTFAEILRPIDPCTYGQRLTGRRILMVNATQDEVIPRASTDALLQAIELPTDVVWLEAGHYSVARYLPIELYRLHLFFQGRTKPAVQLRLKAEPSSAGAAPHFTASLTNLGTVPVTIAQHEADQGECPFVKWNVVRTGEHCEHVAAPPTEATGLAATLAPGESQPIKGLGTPTFPGPGRYKVGLVYTCSAAHLREKPPGKMPPVVVYSNLVEVEVR